MEKLFFIPILSLLTACAANGMLNSIPALSYHSHFIYFLQDEYDGTQDPSIKKQFEQDKPLQQVTEVDPKYLLKSFYERPYIPSEK